MHDKQLLTLNHEFHEWCHLVEGIQHERTVDFEHRYFMSIWKLYIYIAKIKSHQDEFFTNGWCHQESKK
jgi:hypothetical protein